MYVCVWRRVNKQKFWPPWLTDNAKIKKTLAKTS